MVDGSSEGEVLDAARDAFESAISHPVLNSLPVLLLVTHQDKETAKSSHEVCNNCHIAISSFNYRAISSEMSVTAISRRLLAVVFTTCHG